MLCLALIWLMLFVPLKQSVAERDRALKTAFASREEAADLAAMVLATEEPSTLPDDISLLALLDRRARDSGLGPHLVRQEPVDDQSVRIYLQRAPFANLLTWLSGLAEEFSISVSDAAIEQGAESGTVDARITLTGA